MAGCPKRIPIERQFSRVSFNNLANKYTDDLPSLLERVLGGPVGTAVKYLLTSSNSATFFAALGLLVVACLVIALPGTVAADGVTLIGP